MFESNYKTSADMRSYLKIVFEEDNTVPKVKHSQAPRPALKHVNPTHYSKNSPLERLSAMFHSHTYTDTVLHRAHM